MESGAGHEVYWCPTCGKPWFGAQFTSLAQVKAYQKKDHSVPCDRCDLG